MRRKRSVKPARFRSVGIAMFFVVSAIAAIAVIAAEWRQNATGVDLDVRGISITSTEDIVAAIGITDSTSLSSIDLLETRRKILQNPYIRDVDLMRDPPRTLIVEVNERKPIAMLINLQADDWLVDEDGYVLPAIAAPEVYDLPVLTGASGLRALKPGVRIVDSKVQKALQVLKSARLMGDGMIHLFSEISITRKSDLVLYTMEAGVPVILGPAHRIQDKLRAFRTFWENVAMKYDPASLEYVDLRWNGQVVTRWNDSSMLPEETTAVDSTKIDAALIND